MSMRTGYVSVKDKARQVAEIILDQMNLSTGEAISVPPGTFLENIDGLREDELLSILDKWQREGFLEYEQREAPSITMFGWSSAWTDTAFGERADDRLEQKPIGGNLNGDRFAWLIWCKPDREKLEKYLGEESKKPYLHAGGMTIKNLKNKLQRFHEKIMAIGGSNTALGKSKWIGGREAAQQLGKLLHLQLLHFIESSDLLNSECERRLQFFHNLAKDKKYLYLITEIHELTKAVHSTISHEKLSTNVNAISLQRPKTGTWPHIVNLRGLQTTIESACLAIQYSCLKILEAESPLLSLREFHTILKIDDQWRVLGETETTIEHSWEPVLHQYEFVLSFLKEAYKSKAVVDEKKFWLYFGEIQKKVEKLKTEFEGPFERLNLHAFDYFFFYARKPRYIGDEMSKIEHVKNYADEVCTDLLQFLEDQEDSGTVEPINAKVSHEEHQKEMSELGASQSTESDNTVLFKENGSVFIGKKKVGTVPTGTIYYCFFEYLYKKRGEVISYKDITSHILEWDKKIGSAISKTPNAYCQNLKCDLVERASIPRDTLHVLIKSGRTKDKKLGYKMEESVDMTRIQPESS